MFLLDHWVHRLTTVLYILIFVGTVGGFLWVFGGAVRSGSAPAAAGTFAIFLVPCGIVAGIVLLRLVVHPLVEKFFVRMLAAGPTLDEAPPVLSVAQGLMNSGDLEAAAAEVGRLAAEYPGWPEVALLRFELECDRLGDPDAALEHAKSYFSASGRQPGSDNFTLLMRCADLCRERGRSAEAAALLKAESRRRRLYEPGELRLIGKRIQTIGNMG